MPRPLPIDPLLPQVVSALRQARSLVVKAPPGAGKTTRVPLALLQAGLASGKEMLVLQPRRLATRLAARRVASELGEAVGRTVGYQVRFESVGGPDTRLWYITEGVLERRFLSDPCLERVGMVVLDEFHERHLSTDLCLALLRRLQLGSRVDLKLVVMSATMEAAPIAEFLAPSPVLEAEGRPFEVAIEYLPTADSRALEQQVLAAVKRLQGKSDGDVLVFLPGASEIRRAREACDEFATRHGIELHALHGDLSLAEQDRAVTPSERRKVILSTNVAETSVTIEGVSAVIDSGLARIASHSPWSGLPTLKVARISKASAVQRAGRAGRTGPGMCLRLYTRHDYNSLAEQDVPEIQRADLAAMVLTLESMGIADVFQFPFFEPAPRASVDAALKLLRRLGAMEQSGALSAFGKRMAQLPLHPRLAALVAQGERRGIASDAISLAALLADRDIRQEARVSFKRSSSRSSSRPTHAPSSDVIDLLTRFRQASQQRFGANALRELNLDPAATQSVERSRQQLARAVQIDAPKNGAIDEEALRLAILAAYPDRVAKRRSPTSPEVLLFGGGTASFDEVDEELPEWLVALDAEERDRAHGSRVSLRLSSRIEAEWLLGLSEEEIASEDSLEWNAGAHRVDQISRLKYGNLILEEKRAPAPASDQTAELLWAAARSAGLASFVDMEALEQWRGRVEFVSKLFPEAGLPQLDDEFLYRRLREMCSSARSFGELAQASLLDLLSSQFSQDQQRILSTMAPERVTLASGRQLKVKYERGKPPWVESRLQDFFGMEQAPLVAGGRASLVLHLLAPSQRPVQVTSDLKGFWSRHYPAIRKELSRKYPRHSWPEDPIHAKPPEPKKNLPSPSGRGSG